MSHRFAGSETSIQAFGVQGVEGKLFWLSCVLKNEPDIPPSF